MVNATREAFQAVFSVMSNTFLRQAIDSTQAQSISATASTVTTRLFVYQPFAYVVSFMITGVVVIFVVALYTHSHPSIMHEANGGLISYATIAHQSHLGELIDHAAERSHSSIRESLSQSSEAWDRRLPNGSGAGVDQHRSHVTEKAAPWNREIIKTLKNGKILEDPRWRGNWKVHEWGKENERLIYCPPSESSTF